MGDAELDTLTRVLSLVDDISGMDAGQDACSPIQSSVDA